jgi:hypothetical protein
MDLIIPGVSITVRTISMNKTQTPYWLQYAFIGHEFDTEAELDTFLDDHVLIARTIQRGPVVELELTGEGPDRLILI